MTSRKFDPCCDYFCGIIVWKNGVREQVDIAIALFRKLIAPLAQNQKPRMCALGIEEVGLKTGLEIRRQYMMDFYKASKTLPSNRGTCTHCTRHSRVKLLFDRLVRADRSNVRISGSKVWVKNK